MTCTRIEIILGCMFSGKSTELLRRINRWKAIGKKILLINHTNDIRTNDSIQTHNNQTQNAIKLTYLNQIDTEYLNDFDVIGIDEAQFFPDLYNFVINTEKLNKIIIISGLDGDWKREPIGEILRIIPLCDEVVKLHALDMKDKDGTLGIFSKRIIKNEEQILVGADECYLAVSRKNYLQD